MKTIKLILMGVMLLSLILSSYFFPGFGKRVLQADEVTFCETYTQQEVLSKLDPDDHVFTWVQLEDSYPESSRIGFCDEANLDRLWEYINSQTFRSKVQKDLVIAEGIDANNQMVPLYAIRKGVSNDLLPKQQDLEEVSVSKSDSEENYALLMTFSESGAEKWASMTRLNVGRNIAILYGDKVISAPMVREEIKGGKCMISGKFNEADINELKSALTN
jgi:hypothetical protein